MEEKLFKDLRFIWQKLEVCYVTKLSPLLEGDTLFLDGVDCSPNVPDDSNIL